MTLVMEISRMCLRVQNLAGLMYLTTERGVLHVSTDGSAGPHPSQSKPRRGSTLRILLLEQKVGVLVHKMHLTKESSLTEPRISHTAHFLTRSKKTPQAREEKLNINAAKSLLEALTSIWGFKSSSLNLRTRSFYAKRRQINFPLRPALLSAPAA